MATVIVTRTTSSLVKLAHQVATQPSSPRGLSPVRCSRLATGACAAATADTQHASADETSSLQRFFDAAYHHASSSSGLASRGPAVDHLAEVMSNIRLCDLGVKDVFVRDPVRAARDLSLRDGEIRYLHIFEDHVMTMGIFCLGRGAVIPLHDHFNMTVLSRLLFGRLAVRAFDWVQPVGQQRPPPVSRRRTAEAMLARDCILQAPAPPLSLFPCSDGNIHEFRALTPCAILDLLTPPYCTPERDCVYYKELPKRRLSQAWSGAPPSLQPFLNAFGPNASRSTPEHRMQDVQMDEGGEQVVMLQEFQPPASFQVKSGEYRGIHVLPKASAPQVLGPNTGSSTSAGEL